MASFVIVGQSQQKSYAAQAELAKVTITRVVRQSS
jgi:hypothetical protein